MTFRRGRRDIAPRRQRRTSASPRIRLPRIARSPRLPRVRVPGRRTRARPAHHRNRRRRRHRDPHRDRPVRERVAAGRSASPASSAPICTRSGLFRLVSDAGIVPRPDARRGRAARPTSARAAPMPSSSGRCGRWPTAASRSASRCVDAVKQTQLAVDDLHGHAGAVPRHRAQDRRRHLRKADRRRRRVLDAHRLHHQAGHRASSCSSPTPTAAIRRRSSARTSRCSRPRGRPTARGSPTCRSRTRSRSSTCSRWPPAQRQVVANFRGSNSAPAWSPDGRRLAVTLTKDGGSQIFLINADGSGVQRLLTSPGIDTEAVVHARRHARCCSRPIAAARRRSTG